MVEARELVVVMIKIVKLISAARSISAVVVMVVEARELVVVVMKTAQLYSA